jgi:hypothetical protein
VLQPDLPEYPAPHEIETFERDPARTENGLTLNAENRGTP